MLCFQHSMSCNLQTTDSGKNISILMRKLREKWVEIIKNSVENSGKMMLKILYEPCLTSLTFYLSIFDEGSHHCGQPERSQKPMTMENVREKENLGKKPWKIFDAPLCDKGVYGFRILY